MIGFTGISTVYLYPYLIDMGKGLKSIGAIVSELTRKGTQPETLVSWNEAILKRLGLKNNGLKAKERQ